MAAKKKPIKISSGTNRVLEELQKGDEPVFSEDSSIDDIMKAVNWYSYFHDGDQAKKWLLDYMKSLNYDRDEIAKVKSSPWHKSGIVVDGPNIINLKFGGFMARMCMRGLKNLPDKYANRMNTAIEYSKKMADLQNIQKKQEQAENPSNKPSIQDHIQSQVLNLCADLEGAIDDFFDNDLEPTIKVYDWLKTNEVKGLIAKKIGEEFTPHLNEIDSIETDEEIKEGYRKFKKTEIKKYRNFIQSIIDDCERYSSNQNKQRKPRKKKPVALDKQVAKLNYKQEDTEYKISSANPIQIIGASQLWVFNTKYRKLGVYIASSAEGLSVKGSTIQGFEGDKSVQKTLRKPEDILKKISSASKTAVKKQFDAVNSKEQSLNGRINNETILLKIVK